MIYFVAVGLCFYLFSRGEELTDVGATLASIGFFGVAVVVIGLAMPMLGANLPKLPVDTIYYSAAILATVVLFVGSVNERAILNLQTNIESKTIELSRYELDKRRLAEVLINRQETRLELEVAIENALEKIETADAIELVEREVEVAQALELQTGLGKFWEETKAVLGSCSVREQRLELERAINPEAFGLVNPEQIFDDTFQDMNSRLDRGTVLGDRLPNLKDAPLTPEQLRYAADLLDDVAACSRLRTDHERISTEAAGYNRLFALEGMRRSSAYTRISGNQISTAIDDETQSMMSLISEIRSAHELAARGPSALESANNAIAETRDALSSSEQSATDIQLEVERLRGDLEKIKDQPLVGKARWAKEQGEVTWPFLLIMMLGMKLARDPLY
ncbi:hypothetical protein [Leisingera caerulea]|uniref:Uncharacterized protein n=1 Tax=Leisingera caerulea TaxID=506591 RepID=A0A9Q9HHM0_LEICA|nr:hypothetical protein [Leisingera caerulea]UWQ53224.1 hypothetical protein K3721_14635 [Leisingera caerulea]